MRGDRRGEAPIPEYATGRRGIIVIPAYNEGVRIGQVLDSIAAESLGLDVVVVDDGSRDDTASAAVAGGARVLRHPVNLGYGAAVQTGYKFGLRHHYDLLVQMDADGQHPANEISVLIEPVLSGEADLVIGSRFLGVGSYEMEALKLAGAGLFRWLARRSGLEITDPTSGFQAMGRRAMEVYSDDFFPVDFPDVDVLLTAHRRGLNLMERPVRMLAAERESTLHSGLKPIYYVYRTLLAMWVASNARPKTGVM